MSDIIWPEGGIPKLRITSRLTPEEAYFEQFSGEEVAPMPIGLIVLANFDPAVIRQFREQWEALPPGATSHAFTVIQSFDHDTD